MRKNSAKGFTLIELLIVLAISAVMTSIAVLYSQSGQNTISLSVESAKLSQLILRAKELSIATYNGPNSACGYGVYMNYSASPETYSLFAYSPAGAAFCPSITNITSVSGMYNSISPATDMKEYEADSWNIPLANGVTFQISAPDTLGVVLFYPPDPTTIIALQSACTASACTFLSSAETSEVYLQTANGNETTPISVNPAGQVTL